MGAIQIGRVLNKATDSVETFEATGLVPEVFDYIGLGYDGSARLTSAVYRTGGAGGTIVATLTIAYAGVSTRIASVTRT